MCELPIGEDEHGRRRCFEGGYKGVRECGIGSCHRIVAAITATVELPVGSMVKANVVVICGGGGMDLTIQ